MATALAGIELVSARFVCIGTSRVDFASNELTRQDGSSVRLSPKAAGVLRVLLAHGDAPVHRERLIELVWPGQFRTDDVITKAMHELRRELADACGSTVIENLPRVGYRLKCAWHWDDGARPATAADANAAMATPIPPSQTLEVHAHPQRRLLSRLIKGAVTAIAIGIAATIFLRLRTETNRVQSSAPANASWISADSALDIHPLSGDAVDEVSATVSPDGRWVVVSEQDADSDRSHLVLRSIDGLVVRALVTANEQGEPVMPKFSPDGSAVAFQRITPQSCRIEIQDLLGGAPRPLSSCAVGFAAGLEFFPDGRALLLPRVGVTGADNKRSFERLDVGSGQRSDFAYGAAPVTPDVEGRFSPDARHLLIRAGAAPWGRLRLVDMKTWETRSLGDFYGVVHGMTWLQDSRHAVIASDATGPMMLWRLDTQSGRIEPMSGLRGQFPDAARRADVVVFQQTREPKRIERIALDGSSDDRRVFASAGAEWEPALHPDARQLAFVSDRTGKAQIYLGQLDDGSSVQLTHLADAAPFDLSFSPDGSELAFGLRSPQQLSFVLLDLATGKVSEPSFLDGGLTDMRFDRSPNNWLYVRYDAARVPYLYRARTSEDRMQLFDEVRLSSCAGRAPVGIDEHWVYFLSQNYRSLQRVAAQGRDAPCEVVSDSIMWASRGSWAVRGDEVLALLTPARPGIAHNGIYALSSVGGAPALVRDLDLRGVSVPSGARFAYASDAVYATVVAHRDADIMVLQPAN